MPLLPFLAGFILLWNAGTLGFAQDAAPQLLSATHNAEQSILLTFSAPVVLTQRETIGSFLVTDHGGAVSISMVHLLGDAVALDVPPLHAGRTYTVHVTLPTDALQVQTATFTAVRYNTAFSSFSSSPAENLHPAAPPSSPLAQSGAGVALILAASGAFVGWRKVKKSQAEARE